ncbi:MAG: 6-carboxytetrahydropterin synthase [Halomonas sp.]|nr:6-carboxytetrahydropterin synthase [Halomonas sp.]
MTLFVNGLTHLDASIWCPQSGLLGASWLVDAELDGQLGADGMLFDFAEVKPWIKKQLDAGPDHTLIVPTEAPGVSIQACSEGLCVSTIHPYPMEVRGPRQAFTLLPWKSIDAPRLAAHYAAQLSRHAPPRVESVRLRFHEEAIEGATYRYSHGLKRHTGNCQRIVHGHRSRLHIWEGGRRQPGREADWARQLDGRYFIAEEDIVDCPPLPHGQVTLRYRASQGSFQLRLPRERCVILPTSTTVELIAAWLADRLVADGGAQVRVQAFEGIGKGALAEG